MYSFTVVHMLAVPPANCRADRLATRGFSDYLRYKRFLKALDNLASVDELDGSVLSLVRFVEATFPLLGERSGAITCWEITVACTFSERT